MKLSSQDYERFLALNPCFDTISKYVTTIVQQVQSKKKKPLTILDLGAGTGLQARMLAKECPKAKIIAVEQDEVFFAYLKKRVKPFSNITVLRRNVVSFRNKQKANIVILRFVYHHIPDNLKIRFLKSIRANLIRSGVLIIVEECLREYSNESEHKQRDEKYHRYRIKLAKRTHDLNYVTYQKEVCEQNMCPYKVSVAVLTNQLRSSDFVVNRVETLRGNIANIDYQLFGQTIILASS